MKYICNTVHGLLKKTLVSVGRNDCGKLSNVLTVQAKTQLSRRFMPIEKNLVELALYD